MKHAVPHPLSRTDAKRALDLAWSEYSQRFAKYSPQLDWLTAEHARIVFHALGKRTEAQVRVLEHALEIEMDVPFMARPFVGRATAAIDREVARWIAKVQAPGQA